MYDEMLAVGGPVVATRGCVPVEVDAVVGVALAGAGAGSDTTVTAGGAAVLPAQAAVAPVVRLTSTTPLRTTTHACPAAAD